MFLALSFLLTLVLSPSLSLSLRGDATLTSLLKAGRCFRDGDHDEKFK